VTYHTWRAPMLAFGIFGFVLIGAILLTVRSWLTETHNPVPVRTGSTGSTSLWNLNSAILTILCLIHGLSMYGFLGSYPLFLREQLHYSPELAGFVISFFGWGALASIPGGWLGDRLSPRLVLSSSFVCIAVLGYYFFQPTGSAVLREALTCVYGVVGSAVLYVNLAGYHVKALRGTFASRGSGMFVSSLYGGGAFGGYLLGRLATGGHWMRASEIQMSLLCL